MNYNFPLILQLAIIYSARAVFIFTSYPEICIETYHSHLMVKKCSLIETQNFQYENEQIYLVNTSPHGQNARECFNFDSVASPVRLGECQTKIPPFQKFELLRGIPKGTLIKFKGSDLCLSIIDLNYPLHFKQCDVFDPSQIFSFEGAISKYLTHAERFVKRPGISRLYTS